MSNTTIVKTYGRRIEIHRDQDPENPLKDWDCYHDIDFVSFNEHFEELTTLSISKDEIEVIARNTKDYYVLPIYFNDLTREVYIGEKKESEESEGYIIYKKKEGILTDEEDIEEYLGDVVEILNAYTTGNVYGYKCIEGENKVIDSLWGFYLRSSDDWDEMLADMAYHLENEWSNILGKEVYYEENNQSDKDHSI